VIPCALLQLKLCKCNQAAKEGKPSGKARGVAILFPSSQIESVKCVMQGYEEMPALLS
jgi:hypothetical protein